MVSGAGGAESSLPQTKLVSASANVQTLDAPQSILDLSKPFDGLPKGGLAALLLGNKRKYAQIDGEEEGTTEKRVIAASQKGATPIVVNSTDGLLPALPQPAISGQQVTPEFIRPAVLNPALSVSQLRLAVPRIRIHIVQGIDALGKPGDVSADASSKSRAEFIFEARNPSGPSLTQRAQDREPCRITLTRKDQPLWQDFLPRAVLLITGNHNFWAAADETGSIYIWTPHGRRLNSAIVMEAQPVILASYESWLLCITAVGMCYVWNVKTMSSPHPPVSLAPVLDTAIHSLAAHPTGAPAVTQARLNSEGRIIISLSNGEGYSYSPQMYCWQRLSEVWWAVGSQYWNTTDTSVGNIQSSKAQSNDEKTADLSSGVIPWLERNTTSETLLRGRAYFLQRLIKVLLSREGFESFESGVSIAHLENRIAAALMLGAKEEFRIYVLMYAKRLGAEGLRLKVEELLRTLVGGIVEQPAQEESIAANINAVEGRNWQEDSKTICGWPREDLLKDVVLILGKHFLLMRAILAVLYEARYTDRWLVSALQENIATCNELRFLLPKCLALSMTQLQRQKQRIRMGRLWSCKEQLSLINQRRRKGVKKVNLDMNRSYRLIWSQSELEAYAANVDKMDEALDRLFVSMVNRGGTASLPIEHREFHNNFMKA